LDVGEGVGAPIGSNVVALDAAAGTFGEVHAVAVVAAASAVDCLQLVVHLIIDFRRALGPQVHIGHGCRCGHADGGGGGGGGGGIVVVVVVEVVVVVKWYRSGGGGGGGGGVGSGVAARIYWYKLKKRVI
jgi:hypothetical protein